MTILIQDQAQYTESHVFTSTALNVTEVGTDLPAFEYVIVGGGGAGGFDRGGYTILVVHMAFVPGSLTKLFNHIQLLLVAWWCWWITSGSRW